MPLSAYLSRHRRSVERGAKAVLEALFLLLTSFLLWYLVEMLVTSLLSGVPGLVVQMLASLALTLYASCAVAAFYRRLTRGETEEPVPEALN